MSSARLLALAGAALALVTAPVALLIAPPDAVQGEAQRWMYLHVPAAWSAYACFAAVLICSIQVLVRQASRGSVARAAHAAAPGATFSAQAAAEVGLALTILTLLTGSIWGRFTWGTWWAWDARVATTVALACVYAGYLAVVRLERGPARRASAVIGIVGFAMVPVVHMSVVWWRTLHQPPTILAPESGTPIDPVMGLALALAVVTFSLLTGSTVLARSAALRGRSAGQRSRAVTRELTPV